VSVRRRSINYSGRPPLVFAYVDGVTTNDGPTVTLNFGAANAKRYLIAAVGVGSSTSIPSITIGGVTAPLLIDVISPFGGVRAAYYMALVPSGTSGSVTVGTSLSFGVALYSVWNLINTSPVATATNSGSSPLAMSIAAQRGGLVLATAYQTGGPGPTAAWTGLTTVDINQRFSRLSFTGQFSSGQYPATATATQNLSVTLSGTNAFSCAAISLR